MNIGSFAVHVTSVIVHSGGSTKAAIKLPEGMSVAEFQ